MPRPLVSPEVESLRPYEPGKPIDEVRRELGVLDPVKLASNENPWGPSPRVIDAIAAAAREVHLYPDGAAYYLRQELAAYLGVGPDTLVFGNGSNELLELAVRAFVLDGDNVVTSEVSFVAYKLATLAAARELREAPVTAALGIDLDGLLARCDGRTRLIFIANPNNPTGTHLGATAIDDFLRELDARFGEDTPIVLLDEAYLEYVSAPDAPDGLALVARRPRTILTRTFSKAYGLAGARCGYAVTSPQLANYLNRVREPFNLSNLAQAGARAALADQDHMRASVESTVTERGRVAAALEGRGFDLAESQANFVLADFRRDAGRLYQDLMRHGVITRPMHPYGLTTHLRITIGLPSENDRMLAALDAVLSAS